MASITVQTDMGWDYAEPTKRSPSYSGVINSQVSLKPLAYDWMPLRAVKGAVAYQLTNDLAGWKRPSEEVRKRIKSPENHPTIYAEIESEMGDEGIQHDIKLGVHMPDPNDHSVANCLEAYSVTIANSVVDLLPTKDMIEKAWDGQMVFTQCDIQLDSSGRAEWGAFESSSVSSDIRRIAKGG